MLEQLRSGGGARGHWLPMRWPLMVLGLVLYVAPLAGWSQPLSRSGARSVEPLPTQATIFAPNAAITEGFDAGLDCPVGWTCINTTTPVGSQPNWFDGDSAVFPQQAGSGYIAANYLLAGGVTTISAWLISPPVDFVSGAELRFWSRAVANSGFADRLEIRSSSGGIDTGGSSASVGDFTNLLGTINPTLSAAPGTCVVPAGAPNAGGYPFAWCEYSLTNANGLPLSGSGRIAFRYFVTDGGIGSSNADYIGIDTFSFADCTTDPVVTNGNDSGPGSLRQVIVDACAGSTITFAPSVTSVELTSFSLVIDKSLTIDGGTGVTVAGADVFQWRIFLIASSTTVVLDSLTISNGRAVVGPGGGISNLGGQLTVANSTISGNIAGSSGGGISVARFGQLTLLNSTVSGNTASGDGGGIAIEGPMVLDNSTIADNFAGSRGGVCTLVVWTPPPKRR